MSTEQPTKCFVPLQKPRVGLCAWGLCAWGYFKAHGGSLLAVPGRYFCCGSLLPVFGVRVSVPFHLICVHIIFSSVSVAEWRPFGK